MTEVHQNTLYLVTPESYVSRDHLTLRISVDRVHKLAVPIHHLESLCVFGPTILVSPSALALCWEHGVAVNYLSEHGYFLARLTGEPDTSVLLRRTQFRAADDPARCAEIARNIVAGKIQNARNSLLRAARESPEAADRTALGAAVDALARALHEMASAVETDAVRGIEGRAATIYFAVFDRLFKQQRQDFAWTARSRRPPLDRINCLLSFLYALLRHDCMSALTSVGLDSFVGFLHVDRANRPSLALDLMEEFRPWLADRLAVTLINRQQVDAGQFLRRESGAVELTETGRKALIRAYQERKQETMQHPLLKANYRLGQMPFVQARILARHLRGDLPSYVPLIPR